MQRITWAGLVFVALGLGACAPAGRVCGDGFCDSRFETSTSCAFDCGGTACGDGICEAGENCSTCRTDCGTCTGCGDGLCQASIGETCSSCTLDCGSCAGCGDRICQTALGETCSSCAGDCGVCGAQAASYEGCGGTTTCADPLDGCTGITNGGVTRSMCTSSCTTDADCGADMFGVEGDCVFFPGSAGTCFHRCRNSDQCYPGFACYVPTGSTGALTNICLPDSGPPVASVQAYDRCSTSSDCVDSSLECINYNVGGASEDLCSQSPCSSDSDCPFDSRGGRGACFAFGGGVSSCWERCALQTDCIDSNFECTTNVGGFVTPVPVCSPR